MKPESKIKALIDRFEGETAVLLLGEEEQESAELPKSFLPAGSKEGDILKIRIILQSRRTKEAKLKVAEKLSALGVDFEVPFSRVVRKVGPNWHHVVVDIYAKGFGKF